MTQSKLLSDMKSLISLSAVYGIGKIAVGIVGFMLIPLYTRYLTPADYGIIGLATSIASVLNVFYSLSLYGAAMRFYFDTEDEEERRKTNGTIWLAMTLVALVMTLLLDRTGAIFFPLFFREVAFDPYIRLVIWSTFFSNLGLLPLTLFRAQERPVPYVLTTITKTLLTIGLVIGLVVFRREGAVGYLLGLLGANVLLAAPYLYFTWQNVHFTIRWNTLKKALAFSLPLVPHSLSGWVLELSDRVVLEHFVSLSDLGLYNLGYRLGSIVYMVATAINFVWSPFLYKTLRAEGEGANARLARLTTYYTLFLAFVSLFFTLFAKSIIVIFTTPDFHATYKVVPWVVWGQLLSSLYYIPVSFLFFEKKTKLVPIITLSSGLINVALNLWLVPKYGIMGAAWATLLSYAVMLFLVWIISQRVYSFPYEYKRLTKILLVLPIIYILNLLSSSYLATTLLFLLFPLLLLGFVFTPSEKKIFFSLTRRVKDIRN